jgi:uncharacterized protein
MVTERILWVGWNYDVFGPHGGRPLLEFVVNLAFTYGSTALSLGYAATIVLMSRDRRWRSIVAPLAPVGRMALTAYLTQTLVFTTIFYGYALGLASWMGPAAVSGLAVVIFSAQILACGWWLRRYRFGPAEWAWRAMTYLQLPPMRARPSSIEGGAG